MNREHWKELLPIITAFANGEEVEHRKATGEWHPLMSATFTDPPTHYRIAPGPRTCFVNEYPNGLFSTWPDRRTADLNSSADRVACHEVQIPPVQG